MSGRFLIVIIEIQSVTNHEFIGNIESDIIDLNVSGNWAVFAEKHAGLDAGGALLAENGLDEADGLPGVEDVVNKDDAAAVKVPELLGDNLRALTCHALTGIAADGDHTNAHGDGDVANEVRAEDHRAGEDGDDCDFCARAVELGGGVVEP